MWQRGLEPTYAATPARPDIAARVSASRRARAVASAAMCKGALVGELVDGAEMPAGLECKSLPSFTRAEVAEHRHDLVIVEDRVYDAAKFMWAHPGGAVFVAMFGGRDGTLTFQSYHMREFPHGKMAPYLVGVLDAREEPVAPDARHLALSRALAPVLARRGGSFAPPAQVRKAAGLLAAAVALEACMLATARTWAGSALLGLLFALIGLNVQHDANHGAMFKDGRKNALWGLAQSWIGGSQLMWLQEHVVLHHMHTGDVEYDPDAQLAPVMRGHAGAPWLPWMRFQQFYFLLVELGYGVVPMFMSFFEVLCWRHKFERKFALSRLAWRWGLQSVALHLLFYARMVAAPVAAGLRAAAADPGAAAGACVAAELAKVAVTVGVAGGYLAFFFFLSHNFDGVHFVAGAGESGDQRYPERSGFLHQQASSSSNVAGEKLCALNGGLNYQIEHHLFPRVAHSHYPHIAPVVRAFCERHGAPYVHFDSVGANLASVFAYLAKFSSPDYDAPVPKPEGPKAD